MVGMEFVGFGLRFGFEIRHFGFDFDWLVDLDLDLG